MGYDITFTVGARKVGRVHFSPFSSRAQSASYGIDWVDCLTYGEEEELGDGWYQPDWDRALERATALKAKVGASENEHRRQYDGPRIDAMHRFIVHCADPSRRPYAYVRIG